MPKLTVEIDLDIDSWFRAKRSMKRITSHTQKYVEDNFKPRPEWVIFSSPDEGRKVRTRDNSDLYLRFVYTSKLTVRDLGYWIGYVGDNGQTYIFGLPKMTSAWGRFYSLIYNASPTTRKNAFKKLKERLGAYLDYVNEHGK